MELCEQSMCSLSIMSFDLVNFILMLFFNSLSLNQCSMNDISTFMIVISSPLWKSMINYFVFEHLEIFWKDDFFQIFMGFLSWSISYSLETCIPKRLLKNILDAVYEVDFTFDMVTPLLKNESFPRHIMILVDSRHNKLYDIFMFSANNFPLILLSVDSNS